MSKKGPPPEEGPNVPAYIVTFSDMVTLLLTFFVLLLSLATEQDPALFDIGKDSFQKAISGCGLGMLMGREKSPEFGNIQLKYRVEHADDMADPRTIDEEEEKLKQLFDTVQNAVSTMPSQIVAQNVNFSLTDIKFDPTGSILNQSAQKYLLEYSRNMQKRSSSSQKMIYILGLSNNLPSEKANLVLSAKRARVVADFIRKNLSSPDQWDIYSWGAGEGGEWVDSESPISNGTHICIAVLTE